MEKEIIEEMKNNEEFTEKFSKEDIDIILKLLESKESDAKKMDEYTRLLEEK